MTLTSSFNATLPWGQEHVPYSTRVHSVEEGEGFPGRWGHPGTEADLRGLLNGPLSTLLPPAPPPQHCPDFKSSAPSISSFIL